MVAGFAWNGWQPCRGPRGSVHVDWVAAFPWIGWQASRGLSGNLPLDWVAGIRGIRSRAQAVGRAWLNADPLVQFPIDAHCLHASANRAFRAVFKLHDIVLKVQRSLKINPSKSGGPLE